jgi:hypothetical protein
MGDDRSHVDCGQSTEGLECRANNCAIAEYFGALFGREPVAWELAVERPVYPVVHRVGRLRR